MRDLLFALLALLFSIQPVLAADDGKSLPLWDYGLGVGFIRFEQYPGSNQEREFLLPFPAFQYRGKMLRADDREGARAYLIKSDKGSLELGGGVIPGLKSDDNDARRGMEDLLWNAYLGPQFVIRPFSEIEFKVGIFKSILSDLKMTRMGGWISEAQALWHVDDYISETEAFLKSDRVEGRFALTIKAADDQFNETYYEVTPKDATASRPVYEAQGGIFSWSFSYLQSVEYKKFKFYGGFNETRYDIASNENSPLLKRDRNLGVFAGITYTLGESEERAVPLEETKGILKEFRPSSRGTAY